MQQVRLIADSGGTKADWALVEGKDVKSVFSTRGINPFALDDGGINVILRDELLPQLKGGEPDTIDFYGAGCRSTQIGRVANLLSSVFPRASRIRVSSDLLGAARALFAEREGIACILGTGANSGIYDGREIVRSMPAMGFIIGDEGSGASLGKRLLSDVFKKQLPESVCKAFFDEYGISADDVVENTYRKPAANKYLASFVPFIHKHLDIPEVRGIVLSDFEAFFRRNISPYGLPDAEIGFVGGVACHFAPILRDAASGCGFNIGNIIDRPFDRLSNLIGC